jgi:hypothetical protein
MTISIYKKYKPLPIEPLTDSVNVLFYRIYYENPTLVDVVSYIDSNTTVNSLNLFLEELYTNYFSLLKHFIDDLSDNVIKSILDNSNLKFEYVNLTKQEEQMLSPKIRMISDKKVLYGTYKFRNRVSPIIGKYFYIDNTMLEYYSGPSSNDTPVNSSLCPININYLRIKYQELFKIYNENHQNNNLNKYQLNSEELPISLARSIKVKELLHKIIYEDISMYEVINFIENSTSERTYDLFCNELYLVYRHYEQELMFNISDEQFEEAVNYFKDSLVYIYVETYSYNYVKHFTKKICGMDAIFNVKGFSHTRKSEDEIKFIDLNELALRYFVGGFLGQEIIGFEKIQFFKSCIDYLKVFNANKNTSPSSERQTVDLGTKKTDEHPVTTSEEIKLPQNEEPRVFTNDYAFAVFLECYESFYHQGKNELANFSFLFHKMRSDGLIHYDAKQLSYIDFIVSKGIILDRLKPIKSIGNIEYKEEIYHSNKDKIQNDNVS